MTRPASHQTSSGAPTYVAFSSGVGQHVGKSLPFSCSLCGMSFRFKGDRAKHLRTIHKVTKASANGMGAGSNGPMPSSPLKSPVDPDLIDGDPIETSSVFSTASR